MAQAMDARPGLVSEDKIGHDYGQWGIYEVPRFASTEQDGVLRKEQEIITLSIWTDLQSASRFVYSGLHQAALQRRGEWFQSGTWPSHVIWRIRDNETPTWAAGASLLEALSDKGPTDQYFTFSIDR